MALLVFDIGGVVANLDPQLRDEHLRNSSESQGSPIDTGSLSPSLLRKFRIGLITEEQYLFEASRELVIPEEAVRVAEERLISSINRPLVTALTALRSFHRVVCLTNNQPIHWRILKDKYAIENLFDECYLSFKLGLEKPDDDIYRAVLAAENFAPQDAILVDDSNQNILAASRCGWIHSIHHTDTARTIGLLNAISRRG